MKSRLLLTSLLLGCCLLLPSCYRSRCEVWEDTKTCGRYMNKGLRSLLGHHVDSRESANYHAQWGEEGSNAETIPSASSQEFIALGGNDVLRPLSLDEYSPPPSRISPGDPGSAVPGVEGFSEPAGELAALFRHIRFETDTYSISGEDNLSILAKIAHYLTTHPHMYVFVEGHADERGAVAYNLALGSRRANAIRKLLIQNGVNPDQLFTISYGLERPLALGHDEFAWSQNRRGQFKLFENE